MKTVFKYFGLTCIIVGLLAIGGSANDCDGHCMEQANTIGEMLVVMGLGFILCLSGCAFVLFAERG
jgi:hypothetical protein